MMLLNLINYNLVFYLSGPCFSIQGRGIFDDVWADWVVTAKGRGDNGIS